MRTSLVRRLPGYSLYSARAAWLKRNAALLAHGLGWRRPFSYVEWLVTRSCMLRCPHCGVDGGSPDPDELDTREARELICQLRQLGAKRLLLSGGEPLVRQDAPELIRLANGSGMRIGLVTNGFLVPELWNLLSRGRYFLYLTSLDGLREEHDSFRGRAGAYDLALAALERFTSLGVPERIVNTVIQPGNINQVEGLWNAIRQTGATRWQLSPVTFEGRAAGQGHLGLDRQQIEFLIDFARNRTEKPSVELGESWGYIAAPMRKGGPQPFFCGAGLTRFTIMPDGDVAGCQPCHSAGLREGNIRHSPLRVIWENGFIRFRDRSVRGICTGCPHWAACQGGCKAAVERTGTCMAKAWGAQGEACPKQ